MRKRKVHFALFYSGCKSWVAACTRTWNYDSRLWEAEWTEDQAEVTCKKCLKFLALLDAMKMDDECQQITTS